MFWKKLSSRYILNSKWLKVRMDSVELPNGVIMDDYYVVENNNVSLVVAVNDNNEILLKEEYRYAIDEHLTELPGGTFELNECDPLVVAQRELLEETGYVSDQWELLYTNYDYPTKSTNHVNIYLAKGIRKVADQKLDISEEIDLKLVPIQEAVNMCMNNTIKVNGSIAGILKAARLLGL